MSGKIIVAKSRKNRDFRKNFMGFAADEGQAVQNVGWAEIVCQTVARWVSYNENKKEKQANNVADSYLVYLYPK